MLEVLFSDLSFLKATLYIIVAYALYATISGAIETHRIQALGGRAPRRRRLLPGGFDVLYKVVSTALRNDALSFWHEGFREYGNPNNPYTIETNIGNQRLVLTADPENIKAILATQFNDYGKGEQFNKDWHDFLGDSIFTVRK
jgi:hypothetical protein